ncbi:MAG: helix-turn-helix domain-containing protein [Clostridiaceae bacterium]|nr:helix-turn-helix domain-containing protein [Clostridiaceae bacterium]MCI9485165.1 helix-turn-helix domain-containing protein [Clostridiaceae bacterium]
MTEKPNFYAILPASVRYDERLRPNAKLLYAEITAMCGAEGFCVAQNNYFSSLFGLGRKTISELVAQLAKYGYLKVEILQGEGGQVAGRRIWLSDALPACPEKSGYPAGGGIPCPEKSGGYRGE